LNRQGLQARSLGEQSVSGEPGINVMDEQLNYSLVSTALDDETV
jgi:hypothetical protein